MYNGWTNTCHTKWNQQKLVITCSNGTLKPIYKENKTWTTGKLICGKLAVATWMHDHESVRLNPRGKQHGVRKFPKVTNQCTTVGWQNNPFDGKISPAQISSKFSVMLEGELSFTLCPIPRELAFRLFKPTDVNDIG